MSHHNAFDNDENDLDETAELQDSSRLPEIEKYLVLISTLKGHEEFLLDSSGCILSSNLEVVNITGYEEYEIIGKHFNIFYRSDEQDQAEEDLRKARVLGNVIVTGLRLKKRGATFWAKTKIKYQDASNSRVAYKVTVQDHTHRTLSKLQVQSFRDEFLTIFNNPFIGTFKFNKDTYRVTMCNQKILDITGHNNSENLFFGEFFYHKEQWGQFIELLTVNRKVEGFKFIINDPRVKHTNWGLISANLFEAQGYVGGVVMDISEQYHQMTKLNNLNSELESFIYHASHDIRAPLTTVLGLTNLGQKETTDEKAKSYFEMIGNRINHLDGLLKDLTSISYNRKGELTPEIFDFEKEINAILMSIGKSYPSVTVSCQVFQPTFLRNDSTRLRIILTNIVSNSLKYHNPEANSFISIKIRVCETHAAIKITDNGIGIERIYKEKIFEMFFRATTQSNGTGLGLYIVKTMLEKINGKIAVESSPLVGTTFLLTIPNLNEPSSTPTKLAQ